MPKDKANVKQEEDQVTDPAAQADAAEGADAKVDEQAEEVPSATSDTWVGRFDPPIR